MDQTNKSLETVASSVTLTLDWPDESINQGYGRDDEKGVIKLLFSPEDEPRLRELIALLQQGIPSPRLAVVTDTRYYALER